jgi:hypothetical protein
MQIRRNFSACPGRPEAAAFVGFAPQANIVGINYRLFVNVP